MNLILTIESIPSNNWHLSLANLLPKPVWDTIRREVYFKAGYICEVCSACDCEVHAHEVWTYDDKKHSQVLKDIVCLCADCHNIKHWGRVVALVHKRQLPPDTLQKLTDHFLRVNKCTKEDFEIHKVAVGELTHMRSNKKYKINFGKFKINRVISIWEKENTRR